MVVVGEATLVNADVRLPARKFLRVQLDFVGEEEVSLIRQGDDTTKTFGFGIITVLGKSRRGAQAICRDDG
ncbi:MAG: hypothetical protein ACLQIB_52430 [Isosphaeraceae bacterium]